MSVDNEFRQISLDQAIEFVVDNRGRTAPTEHNGIALIATNCVSNDHLYPTSERLRYVSQETYDNWFRSHPKPGDILLTNKGSKNGAVCLVPDPVNFCIAQDMVALRANPKKIYPLYLFAALRSRLVQQRIKDLNVDAVIPHFKKTDFDKLFIPLPSRSQQKFIGNFHFKLVYKIELNRQINKTLEEMALAIFKSWFVDFEPVKAKIEAKASGRDPEWAAMCAISGKTDDELDQLPPNHLAQLKATAALFPNELIDSELGTIPKGWEVASMKDCCMRVESGGTPKRNERSYWNGNIRWLSSGEVRDVIALDTKEKITEAGLNNSSAKLWPPGSTVVAMYGATAGQVCLVAKEMTANQACCALIPKNGCQSYIFLSARRSIKDLSGKASGSAQQNLNKSLVSDHKSLLPSQKILENFEQITSPFLERWIKNTKQCFVLSQLRDTLLPKLLSGEISVADDREKMTEAV